MSKPASSGIRTNADGQSIIPSSRRADGSTRKEIKVRPGYKPPEDVETYKSRSAENWRHKSSVVPGTEDPDNQETDTKNKNTKRREAARRKKEQEAEPTTVVGADDDLREIGNMKLHDELQDGETDSQAVVEVENAERQKKIRNQLKKLKAVRELKAKKATGEKLSADQLIKISKEQEIVRDLVKLDYDGAELVGESRPEPSEP